LVQPQGLEIHGTTLIYDDPSQWAARTLANPATGPVRISVHVRPLHYSFDEQRAVLPSEGPLLASVEWRLSSAA
jgi:hypothetical protein